ncbi:DUF1801 domain-containing protein [Pedobacter rhizosphaerae]|uniref:YdhG-like domain-containing protein n=1 Tax=Pedobacter rhizosphaerae TaxID=390241 RepID=A0A1H9RE02_9SPHI|nr:DUF1801 domain-containing protein [Pedobacter rhizosphaerae]SER70958.1 protein of unknown function (DU1801) [Pedobacter rhizosphaerae]
MAQNKTVETENSATDFLNTLGDEIKKNDSLQLLNLFEEVTGFRAKMWGPAIVGFGTYHYKYDSGREGDAPIVAFSPRKQAISLYLSTEFKDKEFLLSQLGKHTKAKSCIYIKKISDINTDILRKMIANSIAEESKSC